MSEFELVELGTASEETKTVLIEGDPDTFLVPQYP